jgi:DNA polymerase-3 subunit alpha
MLCIHSYYAFRYGILSPEEVLEQAVANDYDVVALTDINSTSAALHFVRIAQKKGVKPVVGVDFRNGAEPCFVALAKNNEGWLEINAYLSAYLHNGEAIPVEAPPFEHVVVVYPFASMASGSGGRKLRANEFIGVAPHELIRFSRSPLSRPAYKQKMVIGQRFTFAAAVAKRHHSMHRLLRAIDKNCLLSKLAVDEEALPGDVWMHRNELMSLYDDFPQVIVNTTRILQECNVRFEYGDAYPHKNLRAYTPLLDPELALASPADAIAADEALLRKLCYENLDYRYPDGGADVIRRLEMEIEVITQKQFVSYFLINWDITSYARSKGYFYVGRGSGANSLVAYILRITDVDPIELDLYFERFINLYRKNPPDFDLDFSWRDRPDITRYIFERFPHCAILATYNTFQYRAVIRELGKVFGLPKEEIDLLCSGKFDPNKLDQLSVLVLRYGKLIEGFPSHLSLHAGGILIADAPIHQFSPTWMPPKGFPTVQFDMVVAEDIGLYKFDILGQRGLGKIKDALAIVDQNQPDHPPFDIHDLKRFKQDEDIRELLRHGDAIGCFYVESPAMRMLMKKLRVDNYLGLVAASSVIRPGVSKSGMMREFILRYRFPEKRKEAHPTMLEIMPETYGVMVYQEDVIKVAHYFAGLSLGEADVLRRGMSGKFRSREEFAKARGKFFSNCKRKGYPDALTAEVWRQVESFAGYAFAKGHSASYAVESYQSLFLKAHYPLEYMVATVNNGGGFYSREHYLHEARMKGATISPPCVNRSRNEAVISGNEITLGFGFLQGFDDETVYRILRARGIDPDRDIDSARSPGRADVPFASLDDFLDRVPIGIEQIDILIRVDAFRFTGRNKRELLWEARFKMDPDKKDVEQQDLFREPRRNYTLPSLASTAIEDAFDQMELLGFPLCDPFVLLADLPPAHTMARDLPALIGQRVDVYGYLVTARDVRTSRGDRMAFGNFVDREGRFLDSVHFPPVLRQYPFRGKGVYRISGIVTEEFDCLSIEAEHLEKLPVAEDARYREVA